MNYYPFDVKDFLDLDLFFWYLHENIIANDWKNDSKLEYHKEEQNEFQEKKNIIDLENLILEYDKNKDITWKKKNNRKRSNGD